MYFYLKEPNSDKPTPIYLIYYINKKEKYFKYSTLLSIDPLNWDFDNRLPKTLKGKAGSENRHISQILTKYTEHLDSILKQHEKNFEQLTKPSLKSLFDEEFRKKKIVVNKYNVKLANGVELFINSKNMTRGQSKSWNEKYNNLKNKLILFDTYKNKEHDFKNVNDEWLDEYCGFLKVIR